MQKAAQNGDSGRSFPRLMLAMLQHLTSSLSSSEERYAPSGELSSSAARRCSGVTPPPKQAMTPLRRSANMLSTHKAKGCVSEMYKQQACSSFPQRVQVLDEIGSNNNNSSLLSLLSFGFYRKKGRAPRRHTDEDAPSRDPEHTTTRPTDARPPVIRTQTPTTP